MEAFTLELEGVDFALTCVRGVGGLSAALGVAAAAGEQVLCAFFRVVVQHGVRDIFQEEAVLLDHPPEELVGAEELPVLVIGKVEAAARIVGSGRDTRVIWLRAGLVAWGGGCLGSRVEARMGRSGA